MKSNISKEQYILTASRILSQEGIAAISIRRLGSELGCNTANLYRYFDGLEELLAYASLRYLSGYLEEVDGLVKQKKNAFEFHYDVWECFCRHSFQEPEIFNNLFFGKYSKKLDVIMKDYYGMFPNEVESFEPALKSIFINGDFRYRDFLLIVRCVEEGYYTMEDARKLNEICIHLYKGYLKDILDWEKAKENSEEKKETLMSYLKDILETYRKQ